MKSNWFVAFLMFLFSITNFHAQEVISNVTSDGNEQRHILQEVAGVQYLIKISSLDSLYTYDLSDGTALLLHTSYSLGAYTDYFQRHTGRWLLYARPDGAAAYDFVNNNFNLYPYQGSLSYSSWRIWDTGYLTLRQASSDFVNDKVLLLDLDLNMIDSSGIFSALRSITEDHYILENRVDSSLVFSSVNKQTMQTDHQISLHVDQHRSYDGSKLLYYKNDNTEVWVYDFDSGSESLLHTSSIDFTRQELSQIENHFLYSNYNSDTSYSVVINKADLDLKLFENEILSASDTKSIGSSVILNNDDVFDSIYVYNFDSQISTSYASIIDADNVLVIYDRYILTWNFENYLLHDVFDGSSQFFDFEIPFSYNLNLQELKVGNKIFFDFGSDIEFLHDLMVIDTDTESVVQSDIIPISKRGLLEDTHFQIIGDDIFVLNKDHLYVIIDDSVHQIDEFPIIENNYMSHVIDNDGVLWAERNDTMLYFYKYQEGAKLLLATITDNPLLSLNSFRPYSFFDGDKNLYVYARQGFEDRFIVVDKETNGVQNIEDTSLSPLGVSVYNNGYFYFTEGASLIGLDEDGNKHFIDVDVPTFGLGNYTKFEDEVLISNSVGIYKIVGLEATLMYEFDEEIISIANFSKLGAYLIYNTINNSLIYKDDQWLDLNIDDSPYLNALGDDLLILIESTGTNQTYTSLYDIELGQILTLPESVNTRRIVDVFEYKEDQYLITRDGFLPNYVVKVFKVSADFSEATEVKSFETTGRGINATFKPYGDEGLFYAGDKLFLMNDQLEFIPLDNITGDNTTTDIAERNGIFYFVAKHDERGRQVYEVVPFSQRVSTNDIVLNQIKVYPNPTQNLLKWNEDGLSIGKVQVFDQSGRLFINKIGNEMNSINVSLLPLGTYYIKLIGNNGKNVKVGKFIKI